MNVYNSSSISGNIISKDAGKSTVSKDGFLKLLAAELQNQDPMNSKDNTEYVAQMAQFSALEQMQNLNKSMEAMMLSQRFQEGSLMIGRIAKIALGDEEYTDGEVTGVKVSEGQIYITAGGRDYSIDDVVSLAAKPEGSGQDVV